MKRPASSARFRSLPRDLLALVLLGLSGIGTAPAVRAEITVTLDSPDPFEPAHGRVVIEAVVRADVEVAQVTFLVDDIVVGVLEGPPFRLEIDVGGANREHRFEVVARGVDGSEGSGRLATPSFRVDEVVSLTLQQLYVTVTRGDQRVLDLEPGDFAIFDEGDRQELVTFARGDVPFTAVALLDSSVSMDGAKLAAALAGAETFFRGMRPLDEGKLLVFSDRILHATPFSTFPDVLTAGLGRVEARGGTAISDHLYLALKQLETRQGRRVVVLLSDGVDSHSALEMWEVLENARRSQALVYWLRMPYRDGGREEPHAIPDLASPWRSPDDYRRELRQLERVIEESGGRTRLLASSDDIGPAFSEILAELRDQYVLGFYPSSPRHDGAWRRLAVRLRSDGLEVRSREGYVDR